MAPWKQDKESKDGLRLLYNTGKICLMWEIQSYRVFSYSKLEKDLYPLSFSIFVTLQPQVKDQQEIVNIYEVEGKLNMVYNVQTSV